MRSARSLCFLAIAFVLGSLGAQTISITPERAGAFYQQDEIIRWQITVSDAANLRNPQYTIRPGGLTVTVTGTLALNNGHATIETTSSQPGWVLLEVNGTNAASATVQAFGGALVAPEKITPAAARPDDFDAFWKSKLDALAAVPINPVVTQSTSDRAGVDYSTVILDGINGSHVQGQLARPTTGSRFPALLIVQWAGVYSLQKSWATSRAAEGWLVLNTQAHDITPIASDAYYRDLSTGTLKDYWRQGNEDRDTSYFLRMYLACHRAAEYLTTRPDWDGRTLVVMGASQGGLQALVTAAIHPKVTAVIADVPAGSDQAGLDVGRVPGWPAWAWQAWDRDLAKVTNASRYYDITNFAPRIYCPVLIGVGLIDTTVPASSVYATYNLLSGVREIVPMPLADHVNGHNAYNSLQEVWLTDVRTARPPTIFFTAPVNDATVFGGAVTLSATATDDVGVVGVQFKLDGVSLGAEDTTAPYSSIWDIALATEGAHTLSATARDVIGNTATATMNVTVLIAPSNASITIKVE